MAWAARRTDGLRWRHLVAGGLGQSRKREGAYDVQLAPAADGRMAARHPFEDARGADAVIAGHLGEPGELAQHAALIIEDEARGLPQADVAFDLLAQHDAAPGQGWAISPSMRVSTRA